MTKYIEPLYTKVTNINGIYHCRLLRVNDDYVMQEQACHDIYDIGYAVRDMLRWHEKMSLEPFSKMADASRHRGKNHKQYGKIEIIKNVSSLLVV